MSRQPGQDYPDILLERYLAGDLGPELRAEIEQGCERSELLRRRLDQITRERAAFLAQDPPEQFAHRVASELRVEGEVATRRRPWLMWLLAPSAATAAAALLVTFVVVRSDVAVRSDAAVRSDVAGRSDAAVRSQTSGAGQAVTAAPPAVMPPPSAPMTPVRAEERAAEAAAETTPSAKPVTFDRSSAVAPTPVSRPAKKPKSSKKRRRSLPHSGGGRSGTMDDLFDAAESPPPPPMAKSKEASAKAGSSPAPAAEALMAAPAERSSGSRQLARSDINNGVKKGTPALMTCIKRARANQELSTGRHTIVLSWSIEPSGRVSSPRFVGPPALLETSLPSCVVRGMRKWRFPASAKGAPVRNFPFGPFTIK